MLDKTSGMDNNKEYTNDKKYCHLKNIQWHKIMSVFLKNNLQGLIFSIC